MTWLCGAGLALTPAVAQNAPPPEEKPAAGEQDATEAEARAGAEAERQRTEAQSERQFRRRAPQSGAAAAAPPSPPPVATAPEEVEGGPNESFAICPGDPRCPD